MSTATKTSTKAKTKPAKKETNATKKPRAYPSYHEMAKEAILALKERSGSSQFAIAKYIEENQKNLPANFKKLLLIQLKKLVADGRLVRVKNSYKLPPKTASAAPAPKPVKKPDAKPKTETKKRKAETVKKTKKPVKSAPAKSPAKKKAKTPVKKKAKTPVKKPKSIKSPAKGAKKAKKA